MSLCLGESEISTTSIFLFFFRVKTSFKKINGILFTALAGVGWRESVWSGLDYRSFKLKH